MEYRTDPHAVIEFENTVKPNFTPKRRSKRPKAQRETGEFLAAARRFIRAAGKRCADGDEIELRELIALRKDLDAAVQVAVEGIKARGHSWAYIASATGVTREAAYQKWGKK